MLYEIKPEAPSQNQISTCLTVTNKRITIPTGMEKPPGPLLQTWTQRGKSFFTGWLYWPADIEAWLESSLWTVELVSPESSLSYFLAPVFTQPHRATFYTFHEPSQPLPSLPLSRTHAVMWSLFLIQRPSCHSPITFLSSLNLSFPPLSNPVCPLLFWTASLLVLSVHLHR